MTLAERCEALYEFAKEKGLSIKESDESYKPVTKNFIDELVKKMDSDMENVLLNKETVKTSFGAIKTIHRNERICRNPQHAKKPELPETITVPAHEALKITITKAFEEKLNPVK